MPARKKQNLRKASQPSGKQRVTTQRRQQQQQTTQRRNMAPSRRQRQEMEYAEVAFTQLRSGDWAVRISGNSVQQYDSGDTIEVQMKDGSTKDVVLGNFIWDGEDFNGNAVELFAVAPRRRNLHNKNTQQRRNTQQNGNYHDEIEDEIPF